MPLTMLLAKALGIYLIIVGLVIMLRRQYFVPVFGGFVKERLTRAAVSLAQLLAGLFLVVAHNVWSPAPAAIITLLGWLAVVEASLYLLLSDDILERFIRTFNTPSWYIIGGLFAVIVGLWLAGVGFGWL